MKKIQFSLLLSRIHVLVLGLIAMSFSLLYSDNIGCWPPQVSLAANFQLNSINAVMAGDWRVGGKEKPFSSLSV